MVNIERKDFKSMPTHLFINSLMSRVIVKGLHLLPRRRHPKRREIPTHPKDQAMFSFYTVVWNAIISRMKCPTRAWERLPVYWVKNGRRFQRKKNR
jgi:hypothetical protein